MVKVIKVKKLRASGLLLALGGALVGAKVLKNKKTDGSGEDEVRGNTATNTKMEKKKVKKKSTKEEEKEMGKKKKTGCKKKVPKEPNTKDCCCKKKKGFKYVVKYN